MEDSKVITGSELEARHQEINERFARIDSNLAKAQGCLGRALVISSDLIKKLGCTDAE